MPCSLRLASASASAIFTLPTPSLPVGGSMVVVVLPDGFVEVSLMSVPSRSPVTSDLALACEPASVVYLSTSRSAGTAAPVEPVCGQTANEAASRALPTNSIWACFFSMASSFEEILTTWILNRQRYTSIGKRSRRRRVFQTFNDVARRRQRAPCW